jgi:hypothetical protein
VRTVDAGGGRWRGFGVPEPSTLTAAEFRMLPMLSTRLSFAEIGAELFLSPDTAKANAVSITPWPGRARHGHADARRQALAARIPIDRDVEASC